MNRNINRSLNTLAAAVAITFSAGAFAGSSDTQSLTFEVQAIDEIAVSGTPSLTVNAATAGSQPDPVTSDVSYAITTNGTNKKVTAAIDTAMPSDVVLSVTVAAPSASGTSAGKTSLSATAADVVTGITEVAESGLSIQYELDAEVTAGVVSSDTRTVTFTITAG